MTIAALVRPTATGMAFAVSMTLTGCATDDSRQGTELTSSGTSNPTPDPAAGDETESPDAAQTGNEHMMQISIRIGDQRFTATLDHSAAAQDLLAQLPVTVDMVDHGGVEKTGPLPQPLSLDGQPEGADPEVGDLGYYAPGNDLVLYYGDQSYFPGIVVLGRLDGNAAERIAALDGAITAIVEVR
jgi:hypothetical protein